MAVRCPPIEDALIAYLEEVFPDRVEDPQKLDPMKALGRQEVVRHLRSVKQSQEEDPDVWT